MQHLKPTLDENEDGSLDAVDQDELARASKKNIEIGSYAEKEKDCAITYETDTNYSLESERKTRSKLLWDQLTQSIAARHKQQSAPRKDRRLDSIG